MWRRKMWRKSDNFQKRISQKLLSRLPLNLICKVVHIKGINYVNLIEISPVVIEIRGVENGDLAVSINNTLVCHTSFLATDTQLCVLIDTQLCVLIAWVVASVIVCSYNIVYTTIQQIDTFQVLLTYILLKSRKIPSQLVCGSHGACLLWCMPRLHIAWGSSHCWAGIFSALESFKW